jgi:hypothetical protein
MISWSEMGSECPACESPAFRVRADEHGQPFDAVVYSCVYCGLYWISADRVWFEQQSAEDLAEQMGLARTGGVSMAIRMRIAELTHSVSTDRLT